MPALAVDLVQQGWNAQAAVDGTAQIIVSRTGACAAA
jgi:hypothetical protein